MYNYYLYISSAGTRYVLREREPKSLLGETTVEPILSSARALGMLEGGLLLRRSGIPNYRLDVLVAGWWYSYW